jgi:hypothetical protein
MKCQKVTKVKNGHFAFNGKKYCQKEAAIQDDNGRWLCHHHYNKWLKKMTDIKRNEG